MEDTEFKEKALSLNLSLDEYIRRNDFRDQFCMMKHRKRERNIDPDALDMSLNEYIQSNPSVSSYQPCSKNAKEKLQGGCGKFDRPSLRDGDSSDEGSDVEMKSLDEIKEEAEDDDDSLNKVPKFSTVESRMNHRVRPQQWRLLPENLEDRPRGVQRLEFLPMDETERFRHVRSGRIGKKKRDRFSSSFSSLNSSFSDITTGTFVEKRGFTFKYGDRNKDGQNVGVIGIDRAKRVNNESPVTQAATSSGTPPININMNWNGFFNGLKKCVDTIREPVKDTSAEAEAETNATCDKLLALLQAKRDKEEAKQLQKNQQSIAEIQGRPISFADDAEDLDEDYPIIVDTVGDQPRTTRIPINVRFT